MFSIFYNLFGAYLNDLSDAENGDTLHVVERQPQPPPGSNSGEATSGNSNRRYLMSCIFVQPLNAHVNI